MRLRFLWPGKTKSPEFRALLDLYAARIRPLASVEIVESRVARGLDENAAEKIMDIEAQGLEKQLKGDYIICLVDKGTQMTSEELAAFLRGRERESGRAVAFVVGGFLGLADRLLAAADLRLSLSRMTFSHELARVVLMEQVYRSLSMARGLHYAK